LGGTAVVKLNSKLLVDGLFVPSGFLDLDSLDFIFAGSISTFDKGNGQKGSEDGLRRKIRKGSKTGLGVGKVVSRGKGGRKSVTSGGDKVTKDGKLGNAAVLGLDKAEAVESFLVGIVKKSKRIPETKRRLGTDFGFEAHFKGRRAGRADRREGSSTDKGSDKEKGTEHF
jgi:hypothetical protein